MTHLLTQTIPRTLTQTRPDIFSSSAVVAFVVANSGLDLDELEGLGSCGGAVAIYINLRTC